MGQFKVQQTVAALPQAERIRAVYIVRDLGKYLLGKLCKPTHGPASQSSTATNAE